MRPGWSAAAGAIRGGAPGHVERLLAPLAPDAALVTVLDGHPAAHAWLGAVRGHRVVPLGVDHFGQGGDIPDLYREYGMDTDAILDACAQALLGIEGARVRGPAPPCRRRPLRYTPPLARAGVVELADTPDLGSGGASRGGSSPSARTTRTDGLRWN